MIDYDTFNKLKERMKAKFPVLLQGYLRDSKNYLAIMEANIPAGDIDVLIGAAHSMKSASGLLGIVRVHKSAETLEYAGKDLQEKGSADFESLRCHYEELQKAFSDVESDLLSALSEAA